MRFTRPQWQEILEAERARGRHARKSLIAWIEKKLNGLEHPAIQIFQEEMQLYPRRRQIPDIIRVVGTSRLDFWREVVRAWKLCDYRPFNLAGMLECFEEQRIPGTRPDHRSHKDTTHHQPDDESPNEQQKHMRVSLEESNEFWLKKFYEQQEAKKREQESKQEREKTD
jgi:hypothetical protein